jgi:hypothetical protein
MTSLQFNITYELFANSSINLFKNELGYTMGIIDTCESYSLYDLFDASLIARNEFLQTMYYLRLNHMDDTVEQVVTNNLCVDFNPQDDWNLFTAYKHSDPDILSFDQRNELSKKGMKDEIYRDILIEYFEAFEHMEVLVKNHPNNIQLNKIFNENIASCMSLYRKLRFDYTTHLSNIRMFPIFRNSSIETVAKKNYIHTEPDPIETTVTLASNLLRRSLEYVVN